jgi:hypothetical protein
VEISKWPAAPIHVSRCLTRLASGCSSKPVKTLEALE